MTSTELQQRVESEHSRLHALLFPSGNKKAVVDLRVVTESEIDQHIPNLVSRYDPNKDTITIVVTEADLEVSSRYGAASLLGLAPNWNRDLLHEIVHEFQFKCVSQPSDEGRDAFNNRKGSFPGSGHDVRFFTAITRCAPKLGMTIEELESSL